MTISLIWAQAQGRIIGAGGQLPWRLPEDLQHFRGRTEGSTVVMGRRTWESLPERFRPLPGRTNVVLTTDPLWFADGARPAYSVSQVQTSYPDCWVIGGGSVYAEFLPHAERAVVTQIDLAVDGDTRAPLLGTGWRQVSRIPDEGWTTSPSTGLRYAISEYLR